ncbi:FAD-binding domain-containing protein [Penicillium malachiteum]|nr:FAD-binding domain-containing protein [Penicillium malachiteum]
MISLSAVNRQDQELTSQGVENAAQLLGMSRHENVGNMPGSIFVLSVWRDALFEMNFRLPPLSPEALWDTILDNQKQVNDWVDKSRMINPHSECYMNEAT